MSIKSTPKPNPKRDKKIKVYGAVVKKDASFAKRDRANDGIYYDRKSGRIGYGRTYGEESYNGRPVDAIPGRVLETRSSQVPFSPFDAPKPKHTDHRSPGVNVIKRESGWAVRRDGAKRANRVFETEREAIDYGRSIARRDSTELRIQDAQGRWREAESYGSNAIPPRDMAHSRRRDEERTMAKKPNVWVSPRPDGSWVVQREGAQRATRVENRKVDAERTARDLARRDGVEVIIQGRDGKIQGRDSYGNDPFPPRDTEH